MLIKNIFLLFLLLFSVNLSLSAQVNFTESNLPIILINTDNNFILDEPKTAGRMQIINNGEGKMNRVDDTPNDFDGFIGIELRGQTSKDFFPKKPYGIETRKENGDNRNVSLLGMPKENDWVLHNPYSDKSLLRNAITYSLAGKIMTYAPRVRMIELVINKEYLGVYLLTEKIKQDKNRVAITKLTPESADISGGYILKFDKGKEIEIGFSSRYPPFSGGSQRTNFLWHYPKFDEVTAEQTAYISNFIYDFEDALKSEQFADSLNGYRKYIDSQTFIDFLLINELTRNVDGYRLSSFMYKDSDAVDGRLKMGPVWDFNLALGNADYCEGGNYNGWGYNFNNYCPQDGWVINFWWKRLLEDKTFRQATKDRWASLRTNEFSDENIFGMIDSLSNLMTEKGAATRNFQKWPVLGQYVWPNNNVSTTYQGELDYLNNWTKNRLAWLDRQFSTFVGTEETATGNPKVIKVYPNPTKDLVKFEYTLNSGLYTTVDIYNAVGQLVTQLVIDESPENKVYEFTWDYIPAPGVYFYNVVSRDAVEFAGKVVVLE